MVLSRAVRVWPRWVVLALPVLCACAGGSPPPAPPPAEFRPSPDDAVVHLIRPRRFRAGYATYTVFDGDRVIAYLRNGECFAYAASFGQHAFRWKRGVHGVDVLALGVMAPWVVKGSWGPLVLDAAPREVYYYQLEIPGLGEPWFRPLDEAAGEQALAECK